MSNPYIGMLALFRAEGGKNNPAEIETGVITGTEPLRISIDGVEFRERVFATEGELATGDLVAAKRTGNRIYILGRLTA